MSLGSCSPSGVDAPGIGFQFSFEEGNGGAAWASGDFGEFLMDEVILWVEAG